MKFASAIFIFLIIGGSVCAQSAPANFRALENATTSHKSFLNNFSLFSSDKKLITPVVTGDNVSKKSTVGEKIEKISSMVLKYAMLMDVNVENIGNTSLYGFVENWYGTRYRMGGNGKSGIDCSAFSATLIQNIFSVFLPRTAREQYNFCEHISKDQLSEGDLVFFNTGGGVSHVGVYLTNGNFVHASSSQGVMISNLSDGYYAKRFIGAGKVNKKN